MIVVKKVKTLKDFRDFVNFPFDLYKNSKYWVPPISKEELNTMDKSKNPCQWMIVNFQRHLFHFL